MSPVPGRVTIIRNKCYDIFLGVESELCDNRVPRLKDVILDFNTDGIANINNVGNASGFGFDADRP